VSSTFAKTKVGKAPSSETSPAEDVTPPPSDGVPAQQNYRDEIEQKLQALSAGAFERFCQRLLCESGFQEVSVTGRSGDGGIDGIGILQVNTLVSFKVLFQCKRYTGS
jgi:restriction system protein